MEIDLRFYIEDSPGVSMSQIIDVSEKTDASQLCRILGVEDVSLYDVEYVRNINGNEKLKDILDKYPKLEQPQFSVKTIDLDRISKIFTYFMKGYRQLRN